VWYLQEPGVIVERKIHRQALKYTLLTDELYRRTIDGLLLKCLGEDAAWVATGDIHEGLCGTHLSAKKMKWTLQWEGMYWPTMVEDCVRYKKGCEACQKYEKIQSVPASVLNPIVRPWPFKGWGLDFIGEVHPCSSKGHRFILVATDYFTKCTKDVPLRNMTHRELINFVPEHLVHSFGVPQTLTTDQGASFMSHQFKEFAESLKIKLSNSSP
jgi:hypothetical protein